MTGAECWSDAYSCLNNAYACETFFILTLFLRGVGGNRAPQSPFHLIPFIFSITESIKRETRKLFHGMRFSSEADHTDFHPYVQFINHCAFRMTPRQVFDSHCYTCAFVQTHIKYSFICSTMNKRLRSTQIHSILSFILGLNNKQNNAEVGKALQSKQFLFQRLVFCRSIVLTLATTTTKNLLV